jgi:hypothetical protein
VDTATLVLLADTITQVIGGTETLMDVPPLPAEQEILSRLRDAHKATVDALLISLRESPRYRVRMLASGVRGELLKRTEV